MSAGDLGLLVGAGLLAWTLGWCGGAFIAALRDFFGQL